MPTDLRTRIYWDTQALLVAETFGDHAAAFVLGREGVFTEAGQDGPPAELSEADAIRWRYAYDAGWEFGWEPWVFSKGASDHRCSHCGKPNGH